MRLGRLLDVDVMLETDKVDEDDEPMLMAFAGDFGVGSKS